MLNNLYFWSQVREPNSIAICKTLCRTLELFFSGGRRGGQLTTETGKIIPRRLSFICTCTNYLNRFISNFRIYPTCLPSHEALPSHNHKAVTGRQICQEPRRRPRRIWQATLQSPSSTLTNIGLGNFDRLPCELRGSRWFLIADFIRLMPSKSRGN